MRNQYGNMPIQTANMLIDFCSQQMYNNGNSTIPVGKLAYYSIHFMICQERNKKIMDDDDLEAMRQAVKEAVQECKDTSMLDLILKLLLTQ